MQNDEHRLRVKAQRRIYVSEMPATGFTVHTDGFATLDRKIPFQSYITATAFTRELRRLAERFPILFPEGASGADARSYKR